MLKQAVFFDRDGVINDLVLNPITNEYEPPHSPEELVLIPEIIPILSSLQNAGYILFLVSNQPDYAKGKNTLEQIQTVHKKLDQIFIGVGIQFKEYYYCYHHPQGIVREYSFACECRKPKPYFLIRASIAHGIDLSKSWMIGDRDSDIECGKAAGTQTILIANPHSIKYRNSSYPDYQVRNIRDVLKIILEKKEKSS
jgi:D-glycero-D-manno-heptose 1,7-bisphosphate phosphatase